MLPLDRTVFGMLLTISCLVVLQSIVKEPVDSSDIVEPKLTVEYAPRHLTKEDEDDRPYKDDEDDQLWPDELKSKVYIGTWQLQKKMRFGGFDSKSGRAYMDSDYDDDSKRVRTVLMIFDGDWEDDPSNLVIYRDADFDLENRTIAIANSTIEVFESSGLASDGKAYAVCSVDSFLAFTEDDGLYDVDGYLASSNCGFNMTLSFREFTEEMQKSSRVTYCGIFTVLNIVIFLSIAQHTQDCIESEQMAKRTSLLTLMLNASIDLTLCLWHLKLAMSYFITFDFMILAALWSFSLYMMVQHRLAELVWKAQNEEISSQGWRIMRRKFNAYSAKFFIVVVFISTIGYAIPQVTMVLIVITHSSWIPQIIHNATKGYRSAWRGQIFLRLTVARFALLFYIFGCPANFLVWRPNYWYVGLLFGLMVSQITLIKLQASLGPRFFVPQRFRPQIYSYYRNLEEQGCSESFECMICLNGLAIQTEGEIKTMHTPCNHSFHEECLKRWMEVKMQCPTCRRELPLVEE